MRVKGHSKIILTDTNTGEVETYDNDNMVTNALSDFLAQIPVTSGYCNVRDKAFTTLKNLLGGVMLFNETLEENANHVLRTDGVGMVANAGAEYANTEDVPELGSFNSLESGVQQDGSVKLVFDWETSQGNGTIKCASLTSSSGGIFGHGNLSKKILSETNSKYLDAYFNYITKLSTPSGLYTSQIGNVNAVNNTISFVTGVTTDKITIKEYGIDLSSWDVRNDRLLSNNYQKTIELSLSNDFKNYIGTKGVKYNISSNEGNTYILASTGDYATIDNSSKFYLFKISANYELTEYVLTNTTGEKLINSVDENVRNTFAVTDNGYLVIPAYSKLCMYSIKIADSTVISKIYERKSPYYYRIHSIGNKVFSTTFSDTIMVFDLQANTSAWTNGEYTAKTPSIFIPVCGDDLMFVGLDTYSGTADNILYLYKRCDYLATINNLAEPVTKTAAKTMKLIYTLTFE